MSMRRSDIKSVLRHLLAVLRANSILQNWLMLVAAGEGTKLVDGRPGQMGAEVDDSCYPEGASSNVHEMTTDLNTKSKLDEGAKWL